jgi:hypothetical protein
VAPPSVVGKMVPKSPTTIPVSTSTKETPKKELFVPLDWSVQVAPPSIRQRFLFLFRPGPRRCQNDGD